MSKLSGYFKKAAGKAGNLLNRISNVFDSEDPIIILPYRGFANEHQIYLKGRVLENEDIFQGKTDSEIRNLVNSYKRFETDELPNVKVEIRINEQRFEVVTDDEGYFILATNWTPPTEKTTDNWISADLRLLGITNENNEPIEAEGAIYFPSKNAAYGIISDVDDTVLQTHVTSRFKLKMLYATFMQDASKRLPMEGMVKLFQAFAKGKDGKQDNPIFYVSHSPWNIYDLLEQFMDLQILPKGPILLRDYGIYASGAFKSHKIETIQLILKMYPTLPFLLFGDSAEKDADFYLTLAKEFPEQIKAIYIRKVKNNKNADRVAAMIDAHPNINAILVETSEEMLAHARANGWLA